MSSYDAERYGRLQGHTGCCVEKLCDDGEYRGVGEMSNTKDHGSPTFPYRLTCKNHVSWHMARFDYGCPRCGRSFEQFTYRKREEALEDEGA